MIYITHITLQTAHSHNCRRDEIGDDAIKLCRELITSAILNPNKPVAIPGFDDYFFSGGHVSGGGLFGTVWHSGNPLVTIIMAVRSRSAAKLWHELHRHATLPPKTDINTPPQVPWIAASLTASAILDCDAMQWLGYFEQCIAWAWVDY